MKIQISSVISCAYAQKINTVNCTVKLRMRKEDEDVVRRFYKMDPNRPMFCRTRALPDEFQYEGVASPEVFSLGNGWYIIHGDGERMNSALKCLAQIEFALKTRERPQQTTVAVVQRQKQVEQVYAERRRVFIKVLPVTISNGPARGRTTFVLKNRALQAEQNKENVWRDEARRMEAQRVREQAMQSKLKALQSKFRR